MGSLSVLGKLFFSFFKTGLFSWGGGTAMLALFEKECVLRYGWLTEKAFEEVAAMNFTVPGVFAAKFAALVGYQQAGILGAITSVVAVSLPGVLIFVPFLFLIQKYQENVWLEKFLKGIKYGAAGMILYSVFKILPNVKPDSRVFYIGIFVTVIMVIALKYKWIDPVPAIVLAGLIGLIFF
jgi:chromate transporter